MAKWCYKGLVAVSLPKEGLKGTLSAAATEVGVSSHRVDCLEGDLSDSAFVQSLVPHVLRRHGRLDVVVNIAGCPKHKPIFDVDRRKMGAAGEGEVRRLELPDAAGVVRGQRQGAARRLWRRRQVADAARGAHDVRPPIQQVEINIVG